MFLRALPVLAAVVLAVAGCGGDDEPEPATELAGPVTVERAGGIAGISTRLVVQPDGSATYVARRGGAEEPLDVPAAKLDALRDALAGWQDVDPDQTADGTIADAIETTIAYDGHEVRTGDGGDPDEALTRVLAAAADIAPRG